MSKTYDLVVIGAGLCRVGMHRGVLVRAVLAWMLVVVQVALNVLMVLVNILIVQVCVLMILIVQVDV